jgi:hypothetical protein
MEFKLDRTAFSVNSHGEEDAKKRFRDRTPSERLAIAFYLNSIAYKFDINDPPRMDRTFFEIRKRD